MDQLSSGRCPASHAAIPPASSLTRSKTVRLQQTRGNRRAVAAGTIDEDRAIPRQLRQTFAQMIERNAHAAGDVPLLPLSGRPDIDHDRLLAGTPRRQTLRSDVRAEALGRIINSGRDRTLCSPSSR